MLPTHQTVYKVPDTQDSDPGAVLKRHSLTARQQTETANHISNCLGLQFLKKLIIKL